MVMVGEPIGVPIGVPIGIPPVPTGKPATNKTANKPGCLGDHGRLPHNFIRSNDDSTAASDPANDAHFSYPGAPWGDVSQHVVIPPYWYDPGCRCASAT